ncbi:MAG: hypothetical protein P8X74_20380, partial [Reinekea sp.]
MDDSVFLDDKHISLDLFQQTIDDETPPQRPPGYQSIDIARLPSAVRRYVQNQGIEHYWQQARIDRLHWASASYPSNVILL